MRGAKKLKIMFFVIAFLALAVIAAVHFMIGKTTTKSAIVDEYLYRPAAIMRVVISMVEKPDAINALCRGEDAKLYAEFFTAFGLAVQTNVIDHAERFDIVFTDDASDGKYLADDGVLIETLALKKRDVKYFKDRVSEFDGEDYHLWMVEEDKWLIVGGKFSRKVSLDAMMDVMIREGAFDLLAEAKASVLSEVFASYAGAKADFTDAFSGEDMTMNVAPQFFITTEIPKLDWIDFEDVDEDIKERFLADIDMVQSVRRKVVEGAMEATAGNSERAVEIWAEAARRNANDMFLISRLDRLMRNATALIRLGNIKAAAKCYETAIVIQPDDAAAVYNYGLCLKRLGKIELAEEILKRAGELNK